MEPKIKSVKFEHKYEDKLGNYTTKMHAIEGGRVPGRQPTKSARLCYWIIQSVAVIEWHTRWQGIGYDRSAILLNDKFMQVGNDLYGVDWPLIIKQFVQKNASSEDTPKIFYIEM